MRSYQLFSPSPLTRHTTTTSHLSHPHLLTPIYHAPHTPHLHLFTAPRYLTIAPLCLLPLWGQVARFSIALGCLCRGRFRWTSVTVAAFDVGGDSQTRRSPRVWCLTGIGTGEHELGKRHSCSSSGYRERLSDLIAANNARQTCRINHLSFCRRCVRVARRVATFQSDGIFSVSSTSWRHTQRGEAALPSHLRTLFSPLCALYSPLLVTLPTALNDNSRLTVRRLALKTGRKHAAMRSPAHPSNVTLLISSFA